MRNGQLFRFGSSNEKDVFEFLRYMVCEYSNNLDECHGCPGGIEYVIKRLHHNFTGLYVEDTYCRNDEVILIKREFLSKEDFKI